MEDVTFAESARVSAAVSTALGAARDSERAPDLDSGAAKPADRRDASVY